MTAIATAIGPIDVALDMLHDAGIHADAVPEARRWATCHDISCIRDDRTVLIALAPMDIKADWLTGCPHDEILQRWLNAGGDYEIWLHDMLAEGGYVIVQAVDPEGRERPLPGQMKSKRRKRETCQASAN